MGWLRLGYAKNRWSRSRSVDKAELPPRVFAGVLLAEPRHLPVLLPVAAATVPSRPRGV